MSYRVLTTDDAVIAIPPEYSQDSKFFQQHQVYQSNLELTVSDLIEVPFKLKRLELIKYSIDTLNHNQLLDVLPVEQYFGNEKRLYHVELKIVRQWVNGFYSNTNTEDYHNLHQLVIDLIYNNDSCAAYIFVHELQNNFYNPKLSAVDNIRFWCRINSNLMKIIDYDDIETLYSFSETRDINDRLSPSDWLNLAIEFDGFPEYYQGGYGILGTVATYYEVLNNRPIHPMLYSNNFLSIIRYEDVDLGYWNLIYQYMISNSTIPRPLLDNSDERVIERILAITGLSLDNSLTIEELDDLYKTGRPAAAKLLKLNRVRLARETTRLDTFLSVIDHVGEMTYSDDSVDSRTKIVWHSFVHDLKLVPVDDQLIYYLVTMIKDWTWFCSLLDHTEKIPIIPVMEVYYLNKKLAHVLAEMGGSISLYSIGSVDQLTTDIVDFMLSYGYRLTSDEDLGIANDSIDSYNSISPQLERLLETADPDDLSTSIGSQSNKVITRAIPLRTRNYIEKFSGELPLNHWLNIAPVIDQYMAGQIPLSTITDMMNQHRRAGSYPRVVSAIRDYITHYNPDRVTELTEEEDRLLR